MNRQQFLPATARRTSLATALRLAQLAQLLVVLAVIDALHRRGVALIPAIAAVLLAWLAAVLGFAALAFVGKWMLGDWPAATRGPLPNWLRTAGVEIGWMARMYLIDQPWRQPPGRWSGGDGHTPLMLVHGFLCNGSVWHAFARRLDQSGRAYATVSLQPSYRDFGQQLGDLNAAVEALCAQTGRDKVLLVGHSMGGLLARAYAGNYPQRCAGVVCVAAPHHGTFLGDLIHGIEGGPPSPRALWLQQFNTRSGERLGVPALNLWSADDNIVIPAASAQLSATPERALHGHGHMALIATPAACAELLAALDRFESAVEHAA